MLIMIFIMAELLKKNSSNGDANNVESTLTVVLKALTTQIIQTTNPVIV